METHLMFSLRRFIVFSDNDFVFAVCFYSGFGVESLVVKYKPYCKENIVSIEFSILSCEK